MSSKTDNKILIPGAGGWEVWQGSNDKGFKKTLQSDAMKASELGKISSSRLVMGFSVREVLAVPFHVQTDDQAMFADLAAMHLERSNIRPEEGAGVLTDVFLVGQNNGDSQLLNIVLSAPASDTMPVSSPSGFDVSARFYSFTSNSVTLWRELGRWVFAITGANTGSAMYYQALSSGELGLDVIRDIKLALTQLYMQGLGLELQKVVVWLEDDGLDPSVDQLTVLGHKISADVATEYKQAPQMPESLSKLVPADVRAEQRKKAEKLKTTLFVTVITLMYLGVVGYFAYQFFTLKSELADQQKEIDRVKMEHSGISLFQADWEQLAPVVNSDNWPLTLLQRVAKLIPRGQDLRFKVFEATSHQITIKGESAELPLANNFKESLKKTMAEYDWATPSATPQSKTSRWEFTYVGTLKGETE